MEIPKFEDISVSTKTFVIMTNIDIDVVYVFNNHPLSKFNFPPKKRGKKGSVNDEPIYNPFNDMQDGEIVFMEYMGETKGCNPKKKKEKVGGKKKKYFRNAVTIVMVIDKKLINFKLSGNGKLQMTGCKRDDHAEIVVEKLWEYLLKNGNYSFKNDKDDRLESIFIPALRNIDFSVGFKISREKLDYFINSKTEYFSLLEPCVGYTGVNIKFPLYIKKGIKDLDMIRFYIDKNCNKSEYDNVKYEYYLSMLPVKEQKLKISKNRYNTFLVFHSGQVIMSGLCEYTQKDAYYKFMEIIYENKTEIEETIEDFISDIDDNDIDFEMESLLLTN